jgi:glycerate dehydrogenase
MNIVFLDSTAIPKHIPIPRPSFPHNWVEYEYTSAEQTIERAKDADIIITSKVILSREVLQQLPKLKLIAITATGTNNVDLDVAKELGVAVKNVTGYSATTVPEHVLGMIFALKHSLAGWQRDQITGKWTESKQFCYFDYPITDVKGSTDKSAILNLRRDKVLKRQDSLACLHALLKYTEDINCGHRNNYPHRNESPNRHKIAARVDEF